MGRLVRRQRLLFYRGYSAGERMFSKRDAAPKSDNEPPDPLGQSLVPPSLQKMKELSSKLKVSL